MKKLSFEEFKEIGIENIKSRYNDYVKTNKEYLKNNNIIDFDLFCLINWFLFKDLKEGDSTGYISNGIAMVNSCIQNYIRIYASKIIEYDLNNTKNIEGLFFLQSNFPDTLKNICFAFLGMDTSYTDELIEKIKKSNFWKNLRKKDKINGNKLLKKIKSESISIKNENIELHNENENIKKQRGTINQYFNEWESKSNDVPKGQKKAFYNDEFISDKPDLKNYPYEKFIVNLKAQNSQRRKALNKG